MKIDFPKRKHFDYKGKAYDVQSLLDFVKDKPVVSYNTVKCLQLLGTKSPMWWHTCENIMDIAVHCQLVENADVKYPLIVQEEPWVILDGWHRFIKHLMNTAQRIDVIVLSSEELGKFEETYQELSE